MKPKIANVLDPEFVKAWLLGVQESRAAKVRRAQAQGNTTQTQYTAGDYTVTVTGGDDGRRDAD
jgi:hypothetical protein